MRHVFSRSFSVILSFFVVTVLTGCDFSPKPPSEPAPKEDVSVLLGNIVEDFYKTIMIGCDDGFNSCELSRVTLLGMTKKNLEKDYPNLLFSVEGDIDIFSFFSFDFNIKDFETIRKRDLPEHSAYSVAKYSAAPGDLAKVAVRRVDMMHAMRDFMYEQHSIVKEGKGLNSLKTRVTEQQNYSVLVDAILELKNGNTHTETFYFVKKDGWKIVPDRIELPVNPLPWKQ